MIALLAIVIYCFVENGVVHPYLKIPILGYLLGEDNVFSSLLLVADLTAVVLLLVFSLGAGKKKPKLMAIPAAIWFGYEAVLFIWLCIKDSSFGSMLAAQWMYIGGYLALFAAIGLAVTGKIKSKLPAAIVCLAFAAAALLHMLLGKYPFAILSELRDEGIRSEDEFAKKKAERLDRI